jgi:outer membrane protein assembly factor BamB
MSSARVVFALVPLALALACHEKGTHEEKKKSKDESAEPEKDPRTRYGNWYNHEPICVADVNEDGIGDVVGLMSADVLTLTAVDGATGNVVWTRPIPTASRVVCAKYCVRVEGNGADRTYSTKTGTSIAACDTTGAPTSASLEKARKAGFHVGDVVMNVRESAAHDQVAEISAAKDGKTLWTKSVPVSTWPHTNAVPTKDGVVVLGTAPGDQNHFAWAYVRATGEIVYQQSKPTKSTADVRNAAIDGDRVFVAAESRMYAIDVPTGNVLWWIGHD